MLILLAAYAIAFIDRQVIGLLIEPIRADLIISDTQIGFLQGPAFGIFYVLAGLPLGWMADRTHRIRLIAAGIFLWSIMTVCSGLAHDFTGLLLARIGVGIGEAALAPAAVSLLADLFKPEKRALPLSIFTMGNAVGTGLALVLGGVFIAYAENGVQHFPLLGAWLAAQQEWQAVFVLTGLLGIPVALGVLALPEPTRTDKRDGAPPPRIIDCLKYIASHKSVLLTLLVGISVMFLVSNAVAAWNGVLFVRKYDLSPAELGVRLGTIVGPAAFVGFLSSGLIATRLARRWPLDAPMRTILLGAVIYIPAQILMPLSPTANGAFILSGVAMVLGGVTFGVVTTALVAVTPSQFRGQIVAIYLLLGNLFGQGLGPLSVGVLIQHVFGNPDSVDVAMALTAALSTLPGLVLLFVSQRGFAARAAAIRESQR